MVTLETDYITEENYNQSAWTENATALSKVAETTTSLNYAVLAIIPIIIFVVMGNILVIVSVAIDRKLRSATNCFLTSLAVADLLVALTVMPPSLAMIVNNYVWPFSDELCGIWVMMDVLFSTSSILHLCMISLDRYLALARPFQHRNPSGSSMGAGNNMKFGGFHFNIQTESKKIKRVLTRILIVWTTALGIAVPIPIFGKINRNNLFVDGMCVINIPAFQIFGSLVAFFLPLVVMFVMYTLTIRTLRRQARLVSNMLVHNCKQSPLSQKSSYRRKGRIQAGKPVGKDCPKCIYTARQFQRSESTIPLEEDSSETESLRSALSGKQKSKQKFPCEICGMKQNKDTEQKSWTLDASGPVAKVLKQAQTIVRFGRISNGLPNAIPNATEDPLNNRCACQKRDRESNIDEKAKPSERKVNIFPRRYHNSIRRISSSVKNRAMASITNEQRASKVLGLIFVLFCLFWCPFFITNVMSRICTTCDQALMGELMNWFVWVGYVSSGVNPCVYTLFSSRFRQTFCNLLRGDISLIHKRKLARSFSSRETSAAFMRSTGGNGTLRRSSKGSFLPTLPPESVEQREIDEDVWLKNVKSARNMRTMDNRMLRHKKSNSEPGNRKTWRLTWHVMPRSENAATKVMIKRSTSSANQSKANASNGEVRTRNKRLFSESDIPYRHCCGEGYWRRSGTIDDIEEKLIENLTVSSDQTWAEPKEDLSSNEDSSSLDSMWYNRSSTSSSPNSSKRDEILIFQGVTDAAGAEVEDRVACHCDRSLLLKQNKTSDTEFSSMDTTEVLETCEPVRVLIDKSIDHHLNGHSISAVNSKSLRIPKSHLCEEDSGVASPSDVLQHKVFTVCAT